MARTKMVAGNWKMNKNLQEGVALATELKEAVKEPLMRRGNRHAVYSSGYRSGVAQRFAN